jgi:hypothetical protein
MPDPNPNDTRDFGELERGVLYLLTDPEQYPPVWSIPDIGKEMDYFDPEAVVYRLHNAGLAHQTTDGFVFATAAAFRMVQIVGQVV